MSHTVTITEAHRRLVDLVSEVEETDSPIFLTEAGEEKAALLSMQSYRRLLSVAEREIRRQQALALTSVSSETSWSANDLEILNRHADRLNQEAADVLTYQIEL